MIREEVKSILRDDTDADLLGRLVDEFRKNRDAREILELLNSNDDELVDIGVWILAEIPADKYGCEGFLDRLYILSTHGSVETRSSVLEALYPFLDIADPRTRQLLDRMCRDEDPHLRVHARKAAFQLGILFDED